MEEPSAHQPYTTMIYTTQAKGYVPKCHCGWVGYRKNLSDFTSGYLAQTEALNEAKVHVGTANQEESMPNNTDAMTTNPTAATDIAEYSEMDEVRDAAWDAYPFEAFLYGYEEAADSDSTLEQLVGEDQAAADHLIGWHTSTMEAFRSDCLDFAQDNVLDLVTSGLDPRRAGMDFWLTRNRHGAGFWDEDYGKPSDVTAALRRLTDASHAYGSAELYVGDDGWIYQA